MNKTGIEYLDYTWNPLAMRCTPVSEGCDHCWHLRMADRLAKNPMIGDIPRMAYRGLEIPALDTDRLREPLSLRKPARIGVQFMGDLFHEGIRDDIVHDILHVIEESPQHTFLVLTKRPHRMSGLIKWERCSNSPLPNLWLGVTVENQARADERIPILLQTPAAARWVSIEPMIGAVNISTSLDDPHFCCWNCGFRPIDGDNVHDHVLDRCPRCTASWDGKRKLNWVTLGGETGPGARPMHPAWVRSVRDQCQAAGVPFFFKGWGEWEKNSGIWGHNPYVKSVCAHGTRFERSGKKIAGRDLDGRTWDEMPEGGKP